MPPNSRSTYSKNNKFSLLQVEYIATSQRRAAILKNRKRSRITHTLHTTDGSTCVRHQKDNKLSAIE